MSFIFLILLYLIQITDWHTWFSSLLFQMWLTIISIPNSRGLYLHLIIERQALRYILKPTLWKWLEVQKSNLPRSGLGFECFGPKACYMIWHRVFICSQSIPSFCELLLLSVGSLLTDQRLWASENVHVHIWILLTLHSLHKVGKIKAVFSAVVLLHSLRFGELWYLPMGFMAAQKHPFPVQSSGSTQPDVSPPNPLLPHGCVIFPSCLDSLQTAAPHSPQDQKSFYRRYSRQVFWGKLPTSHCCPWGAHVPPCNTSSPARNRRSWKKARSRWEGQRARGERWSKVCEGDSWERWVCPAPQDRVRDMCAVGYPLTGLTFILGELCSIQGYCSFGLCTSYSWNMGLGKSDTLNSQIQGNYLERRGGRKSTKAFGILHVICTWHSETFKCLN